MKLLVRRFLSSFVWFLVADAHMIVGVDAYVELPHNAVLSDILGCHATGTGWSARSTAFVDLLLRHRLHAAIYATLTAQVPCWNSSAVCESAEL